jgi:hypothetical protein
MHKVVPGSDLDEMELIGNRTFTVAVPIGADSEFKAYIMAAGSTHSIGSRSIDNILRRNGDRWVRFFEEQEVANAKGIAGLRWTIVQMAICRCVEISELNIGEYSGAGKLAAAKVLIRLESTFRAASQLIQLGYAFESEAVIRLGLEQVAWASTVRDMTDEATVEATSGTGNMTKFKAVFPGAGPIYSRLSDLAHVAPRTHRRFVSEIDGETSVQIKAPFAAKESIGLLLILLDAFLVIGELSFVHAGMTCHNVDAGSGKLKAGRPVHKLIERFDQVLPRGTGGLFASWWT